MQLEYITKTGAPQRFRQPQKNKNGKDKNEAKDKWGVAKAYLKYLENHYTPAEAAARYFQDYPDCPPDKLKDSRRQRALAATAALSSDAWGNSLLSALQPQPYFYTLSVANLKLPATYGDSSFIYVHLVIAEIKASIARLIPKPYFFKIEVGKNANTHVHVIGPFAPQLTHLTGSERAKPITQNRELGLLQYLSKPVATYNEHNLKTYLQAKADLQTKSLPRLSGIIGLKRKNKSAEKEKGNE